MKLAKNNFNPAWLITGIVSWHLNTYNNDYTLSVYNNLNHRVNHSNFILSRDIETNTGPIDPNNTIQTPYGTRKRRQLKKVGTQRVHMW